MGSTTSGRHIAIVGAGIAGLSCADKLRAGGDQVTVFDKSRGLGGRMSTRRGPDWQCDHGAPGFNATHADFQAELDSWLHQESAAPWANALETGSVSKDSSAAHRYVGTPRMSSPARTLATGLDVRTQLRITALQRADDLWQLKSAENGWETPSYSAVMIAIPAPQAAVLLTAVAPELAGLAGQVVMTPCWSVMVVCDEPAQRLNRKTLESSAVLDLAICDSSKPSRLGRTCWLLQASAQWSEEHLDADSDWVGRRLVEEFGMLDSAAVASVTAHRWRYARAPDPLAAGSIWDPDRRIGLCGDWLCAGTVEGAWRSGQALATKLRGVG